MLYEGCLLFGHAVLCAFRSGCTCIFNSCRLFFTSVVEPLNGNRGDRPEKSSGSMFSS